MRRILFAALLCVVSVEAQAQCSGQFAAGRVCANSTASAAIAGSTTVTALFDRALCATNENLALRSGGTWACVSSTGTGTVVRSVGPTITGGATINGGLTLNNALAPTNGGTGLGSYAVGDIIQATGGTTLAALASVATGNALISGGVATVNSWGKIGLTTHVSGTLPIANGGTAGTTQQTALNNISPTPTRPGDIVYYNGTNWVALAGNNIGNRFLQEDGVGVPSWVTAPGTGTVTSAVVAAGTGIAVSGTCTITTTGTCTVATQITSATNTLGANVALNNTGLYFDGPSMAQGTAGTWFVTGQVVVNDPAGAALIDCKLWDGVTVIASGMHAISAAGFMGQITLSGILATPANNIKISCRDATSPTGLITFNSSGNSKDSMVTGIRLQ